VASRPSESNRSALSSDAEDAQAPFVDAPSAVDRASQPRRVTRIATVSHTLDSQIAERLRNFAFRERISESAVIEFALRLLFEDGDDPSLGSRLRGAGAALRRKS